MKNVKPYSDNTFSFHESIISKKKNTRNAPSFKSEVESYNNDIEICFITYDDKFNSNKLEELTSFGFSEADKEKLLKLYNFKSKLFQELKIKITTKEGNIVDNICQNCTISEINSFDHIIPKNEFPEFVVNPKNLFPSCTNCNSRKGKIWKENNKCVFLNLYIDILPNEQYLFVDVKIKNNILSLDYSLKNNKKINTELYKLIKTHYVKLKLFQRFKENSDIVISEMEHEINEYKEHINLDIIKETIKNKCDKDRNVFGYNYWKSVLKLALINNNAYMNKF